MIFWEVYQKKKEKKRKTKKQNKKNDNYMDTTAMGMENERIFQFFSEIFQFLLELSKF